MRRIMTLLVVVGLSTPALVGCDSGNDCVKNETKTCQCADGRPGGRYCLGGGNWTDCDCGPEVTGGADTTAGGQDVPTGGADTVRAEDTAAPEDTAGPVPCVEGWLDEGTMLCWTLDDPGTATLATATSACAALTVDGAEDWEVPTISQLRTLIRGCDPLAPGGACSVTDECSSHPDCIGLDCSERSSESACQCKFNEECPFGEGPAPHGAYLPDAIAPDPGGVNLISRTLPPDEEDMAWLINYNYPSIALGKHIGPNPFSSYRCVRSVE